MHSLASALIAASALILLALGLVHLLYTFRGTKLHPRDESLIERMRETTPVLTRQTTMWRTWIGFNASHSLGAILFGLIFSYLAVQQRQFLFASPFLLLVGLAALVSYFILGKLYWFSIPFRGIAIATALYAVALVALWA
jgi:hypothetical protein